MEYILAVLAVIVCIVFWRASRLLIPLFVGLLRGEIPVVWISGSQQKCPKCGAPVEVSKPKTSEISFQCAQCGEQGTWQ